MRQLLRAELSSLLNLFRVGQGRRVVLTNLAALFYFLLVASYLSGALLDNEVVREILRRPFGRLTLHVGFALGLVPAFLLQLLTSMRSADKLLFAGPDVEFLASAPLPRRALVLRAWVRLTFLNALWGLCLSLPFTLRLYEQAAVRIDARTVFAAVAASLLLTVMVVGTAVLLQVVLLRWFSGPRVQLAVNVVLGTAFAGFVLLFVLGAFTTDDALSSQTPAMLETLLDNPYLVFFLDGPAVVLSWGAGTTLDGYDLAEILAVLLAAPLAFLLAAPIYPRALENHCVSAQSELRRRVGGFFSKRWPDRPVPSLWRKDLLFLLRQPRHLFGTVMFSMLMIWVSGRRPLQQVVDPEEHLDAMRLEWSRLPAVPEVIRETCALSTVLAMTLLMVIPGLVMSIMGVERKHWSLIACAPVPPDLLLRGKLAFIRAQLVYYVIVGALVGIVIYAASPVAILAYLVVGAATVYGLLGIGAAVATSPYLSPPHGSDTGLVVRAVFGALLMLGLMVLALVPAFTVWNEVKDYFSHQRGLFAFASETGLVLLLLGGVLVFGALLGRLSLLLATLHFRRLTGPAPE